MSKVTSNLGRRWQAAAAIVALLLSGCAKTPPPAAPGSDASADGSHSGAMTDVEAAKALAIELRAVDRASYDAVLADLNGKVVLVDFWATWCAPCVEQLPHSARLAVEHRGHGLAVVTVCMDDPEAVDQIKRRLAASGAEATVNLISLDGGGTAGMDAFEITGGALPHYRLYDREGKLRSTFALDPSAETQFTSEDLRAAVEQLLGE